MRNMKLKLAIISAITALTVTGCAAVKKIPSVVNADESLRQTELAYGIQSYASTCKDIMSTVDTACALNGEEQHEQCFLEMAIDCAVTFTDNIYIRYLNTVYKTPEERLTRLSELTKDRLGKLEELVSKGNQVVLQEEVRMNKVIDDGLAKHAQKNPEALTETLEELRYVYGSVSSDFIALANQYEAHKKETILLRDAMMEIKSKGKLNANARAALKKCDNNINTMQKQLEQLATIAAKFGTYAKGIDEAIQKYEKK